MLARGGVTLESTSTTIGNNPIDAPAIDTTKGIITSTNLHTTPSINNGVAGDVTLTAQSGNIRVGSINASSKNNESGNSYSKINIKAPQGSISVAGATLNTTNQGSYYAGDLILTAADQISITNNSTLQSDGYFGVISLRTGNNPNSQITIQDSFITAIIQAATATSTSTPPPSDSSINIDSPKVIIKKTQVNTEIVAPTTKPRKANSGNITIGGNSIQILDNSSFKTSTNNGVVGDSGDIFIGSLPRTSSINLESSTFSTSALGEGNSGRITIASAQTVETTGGSIKTTASFDNKNGIAGNVLIKAGASTGQAITLNKTSFDAAAFAPPDLSNPAQQGGQTGSLTIQAENGGDIVLNGGIGSPTRIFTDTYGKRDTGGIKVISGTSLTRGGNITIDNYILDAPVISRSSGNGGPISIQSNGGNINLLNNGSITTTVRDGDLLPVPTGAIGSGGNIKIESKGGTITLNKFNVNSATNTKNPDAALNSGKGGDVLIDSGGGQITVDTATIDAKTTGTQAGGKVDILSGGGSLAVLNNSTVNASTSGSSTGGNISLRSDGGTLTLSSGKISTESSLNAGSGGDIAIASKGGNIKLENGSKVTSATTSLSSGQGGDVTIQSQEGTSNSGQVTIDSDSTIDASTSGNQTGGKVSIFSGNQKIQLNSGSINTTVKTGATANGGSIQIQSKGNDIALGQTGPFTINAATEVNSNGQGGNINISSGGGNISVFNAQSIINASTSGNQIGGNVSLLSGGGIFNLNSGTIATTVNQTSTGDGGELLIKSGDGTIALNGFKVNAQTNTTNSLGNANTNGKGGNITIESGTGDITLVSNSTIQAGTTGNKNSGTVTLTGRDLNLNQSKVQASSTGTGNAGDVSVTSKNVSLIGSDSRSEISTSASGKNGSAGKITIAAPGGNLTLTNSDVLASSVQGTSGVIKVMARKADLQSSTIKSEIGQKATNGAGNINLDLSFRLTLEDESRISTLGTNGADGGNISIVNVRFLSGKRPTGSNGSDIVGRADGGGQGGKVTLDRVTLTTGFRFGKEVPGNRTNDIDTNGQLNNFSTDADVGSRGLSAPIIVFNDVSQIGRSACEAVGAKASTKSEFKITGQNGIPMNPTAPLPAQNPGSDWVVLDLNPQVPIAIKAQDGSLISLQPGQHYQLQGTCIDSWKQQQKSRITDSKA